ncbi:MAG TPA: DUF2235 domain-containing protein [Candidatus Polarisedimenticolia bacterium]|nr:DUF2235 domain-containing protein [Candidatus Polarisedimenticolia bacterium]
MKKRLVICCDGTWNTPDSKDRGKVCPTNVVKMTLSTAEQDPQRIQQRVYYDKGVGTAWYEHLSGGAFGYGLSENIKQAYRYCVENYELGDELFFFGFSRGAYTARSTVGLIRNCGMLKKEHAGRLEEGYSLYRRRDSESHPKSVEAQVFRRMYAHEVRIKFIGVWDTVGALGIPGGGLRMSNTWWQFHDVALSSHVDNAFQALAIDEHRKVFEPAIWQQQAHAVGQSLEQVWFAGAHSNVGGGYFDSGLSDIAFQWMKGKAEGCGLAFREDYVREVIHPNTRGELRDSKVGMYSIFPDYLRPIGKVQGGAESVDRSAVERLNRKVTPEYRPRNLADYLTSQH